MTTRAFQKIYTKIDNITKATVTLRAQGVGNDELATVGGKGVYTNPNNGDEGYAAAVGGGLQWKIGDSFRLYGDYYYSPDSLSSGIDSYQEANVGASWTIMRPLSIQAGYRYLNLAGKDGNRDNTIADGPYIGASASF